MATLSTLFSGLNTANSVIDKVLSKRGTRIDNKILAIACMQKAINSTEVYLTTSNQNYQPNQELSNLWLEAFVAMIKIDKNLAVRLREKSKFWSNPYSWIENESSMELVPSLQELNEKCEMIMIELEKRK